MSVVIPFTNYRVEWKAVPICARKEVLYAEPWPNVYPRWIATCEGYCGA